MKEDRLAFKNRMRSLRTYREQNPGKGYWEWRNSLPDNLKYTDDSEYDMKAAYESGAQPVLENDGYYHLPSRDPRSGRILKLSYHDTYWKALEEDAKLGYYPITVNGKTYTKKYDDTWAFNDGGETTDPRIRRASPPRMTLLEIKERNRIDSIKYEKSMRDVNLIMDAMNRAVDTKPYKRLSAGIKSIQDNNSEQAKEKWNDYKKGIEAVATAATWFSGLSGLSRYGITKGFLPANKIVNGIVMSDTGLMIANGAGALGGAYQTISSDSPAEGLWNGTQTALNAAGVVGGSNWFRNSKLFRKHGARIDNVLDKLGMTGLTTDGLEMSYNIVDSVLGYDTGGEVLPTRGTTVTNAYGDKTHYIATSMDNDGTLNLSLPDIEITPRNNLNLAGSVSKAMDNVARSGVNAATYVTPLGDVEAVYDIGKNVSAGNYGQAALGTGLILLPNFIEKPIKRIGKLFKKSKVKKELEDVISLSDNIDEVISNDTPININENNIDKFEYNTNTSNDILPSEKNDTPVVEDVVSESTPNIAELNITTVDNGDLFADLNLLRSIDEFQKYYEEGLARDRGLFDQRFDDAVYELREGILNNEDLITRYLNLSSLPNATLLEVENLTDDLISNNYVRRNIKLYKSNYLNLLYDQYNQSRLRLPSINDTYNLRNNIIDRQRIETIRSRINEATEFRDRIRSIPVEERTQELYDQLLDLYNNIFSYIPAIVRNRENAEIVSQLTSQLNNLQNEVSNIGKELLENRGLLINNSNNYHSSISSVYNINNTNYNNLISDNLYDKNNLSKEFIESKYNVGDVTNAIYFSLNPKQAVLKGIDDFNKLKHGQAWNLTHDRAVSTDSYPLQLSLMTKYKDNGFIKVFRDKDNNVLMMRLNDFGRLKGDAAISRINKKLLQISEITGEEGLKAVLDGESILVPKILYRKYEDGGEVEPPYPQFVNGQRVNRWTGQPIATGQATPVFDLRDAADFTPAGDVLAVKDTYEAVLNNDWVGAGLAAVGVLPFVPSVTKKLRREIPTVNKNYVSDAIDALDRQRYNRSSAEAAMNNETYEIVQRLMDDPSYMHRANDVKYRYGDDYLSTYADLINAYNYSPELLPKAKVTKFEDARRAQMIATSESANRHRQGGEFPKLGEYEYQFDPDNAVEGMTLHELDHLVDFLKNKVPDADGNSNMFYRMRLSLKPYSDGMSKYYSNPTEQKAYMNQLREFMYKKGMIKTRDEQVTKEMLQEAMNKLPKSMSSIINASKLFKSMRAYTKWFNQIPLLTAGALGINRYYNQQQEQ